MFTVEKTEKNWVIRADDPNGEPRYFWGDFKRYEDSEAMLPLLQRADAIFSARGSTALEIAGMISELRTAGFWQTDIAAMFDRQETWVSFYQKLNEIPESLIKHLRAGVITQTALVKSVDRFGTDRTESTVKAILNERRQTGRPFRITQRELFERTMTPQDIRIQA